MVLSEGDQAIVDELRKIRKLIKGTYSKPSDADDALNQV